MKPTTLIIIGVIVVALIGAYYFEVFEELNDFVDNDLFPDDDTADEDNTPGEEDTYPDGWNVPGNVNYIVITAGNAASGDVDGYTLSYTPAIPGFGGTHYASTLSGLSDDIYEMKAAGAITQTQYDCGMEQIRVLGG